MNNRLQLPILEIVEKYVELERRGTEERPYYVGLCPFHDERNPSFVVYPKINKAICYACCLEGVDSIGFIRKVENVSFEEAEKLATEQISNEEAFTRELKQVDTTDKIDKVIFALRLYKLYRKKELSVAETIAKEINELLQNNKAHQANLLLINQGV